MPSSYQRIFEYFEVGSHELLVAEIIPFRIPVLYKGLTMNTCKWMNFGIWHEIYDHLDDIVSKYLQNSTSRKIQYVKGVSIIIGYQFESTDPPIQSFPPLNERKKLRANEKENIEFQMCPFKLVACVYPLQMNCSEIELPYYYVRNNTIIKGMLKKTVQERIFLSHLNKQKRRLNPKQAEKPSSAHSVPSVLSKCDEIKNDPDNINLSLFNFSLDSSLPSNMLSSTPTPEYNLHYSIYNDKCTVKQNSSDTLNNNYIESKSLCRSNKGNCTDLNEFKYGNDKKRRKRCSKVKIRNSAKERDKAVAIKSKKKGISEDPKSKGKQQPAIFKLFSSSYFSVFDSDDSKSCNDNSNSINDFVVQKLENNFISNSLKDNNSKWNCDSHFSKLIEKDKDEKLDNIKSFNNSNIDSCDSLPDLHGYENFFIENKRSILKNKGLFLCETDFVPNSNSLEFSSFTCNRSSNFDLLNVKKEMKSEEFKVNVLGSIDKGGLNNGDSYDSLPNLNEFKKKILGNDIENINLNNKSKNLEETNKSPNSDFLETSSSNRNRCTKLKPLNSEKVSQNYTNDSWSDSLPDLTQSCITNYSCEKESLQTAGEKYGTKKTIKKMMSKYKINKTKTKTLSKIKSEKSVSRAKTHKYEKKTVIGSPYSFGSNRKRKDSTSDYDVKDVKNDVLLTDDTVNISFEDMKNSEKKESIADNSKNKFIERVYKDLRNLTIEDFEYHLEKHFSFFENIILGKVTNERDKKLFQRPHVPRDISSEVFISILDENIIDELMEMCQVKFSSLMESSGRNIAVVLYSMLVIIPELLKKVLLSLPCAKENNVLTDDDCEQIFFKISLYSIQEEEEEL